MVKLQTKLISFLSSEKATNSRTFVSPRTSTSSDDYSQVLHAAGWIEATTTTPSKTKCGCCREDKTRRCFAGRQWRSGDPDCRCCTISQAAEARRKKDEDRQKALGIFVPPLPRQDQKTTTPESATIKSLNDETKPAAPLDAGIRNYEVVRVKCSEDSWTTQQNVQLRKGSGNEYAKYGHLVLGRRVTAFASQGLWIRINCDQHAVDCGARWVALAEGPTPETRRWYLKEDAAAAPRCVRKGCTNTSADKPKEMTMRWDVHARLWGGLGWMSERS